MALSEPRRPRSIERSERRALELYGEDLTSDPLWRNERWSATRARSEGLTDSLGDGFVSPLGFRFRAADPSATPAEGLRVTLRDESDTAAIALAEKRRRMTSAFVRRVSVPALNPKHGELTLVIGTDGADLFASEVTWDTVTEPVLLLIAQYARFGALERQFLSLQEQSRRDHRHATTAGLRTLREHKRLVRAACDVRDLVTDWVFVTSPVGDPSRSCSSEDSLEIYSALAEELDIEVWGTDLDEIVIDVEQTYETVSEKLFHYRLFAWSMATEVVIVGLIAGLFY
jgi:hypothetical protein